MLPVCSASAGRPTNPSNENRASGVPPASLMRLASLVVYSSPFTPLRGSTQMRIRKQVHPCFIKRAIASVGLPSSR